MIKSLMKFTALGLLAVAVSGTPIVLHAQTTNAPATTNKPPNSNPAMRPVPFRGKVKAVDVGAMTITVATRTFLVDAQATITKNGKPATLSDAEVGDNVTGRVKREGVGAEAKWTAIKLDFATPAPKAGTSNTKTNAP